MILTFARLLTGPVVCVGLGMTVAGLSAAISPASAADARAGAQIVERWCISCHRSGTEGTMRDMVPSLPSIMRNRQPTADGLRAWLANPHPPMPNLNLGRIEIENIVAYLQSLKK